jgi:hypothetical protein
MMDCLRSYDFKRQDGPADENVSSPYASLPVSLPSIHTCIIQVFDFAVSRPGVQFDVFMGAGGFGANNGCAGNPLAAYDYSPSSFFYTTAPDGNKGQVGYSNYQADCAKLGTVSAWLKEAVEM